MKKRVAQVAVTAAAMLGFGLLTAGPASAASAVCESWGGVCTSGSVQQAVSAGSASPRELAFLRDRTLVNEGRKQVYGTQIAGVKDGAPVPWPCEEPERMDELRAEVGIEPFGEYVAKFSMA